jgi:hypothetical protein
MASKARDFYKDLRDDLMGIIGRLMPWRATVSSGGSGPITITRLGAGSPDGEAYSRLAGFDLASGAEVVMLDLGGKPVALGQLVRSAPGVYTISAPLTIKRDDDHAFAVGKNDGTLVFRVDSLAPSNVAAVNGVHLSGFADDGSGPATGAKWNLDSTTGAARFDGAVTAASLNTPVVGVLAQSAADTASTTSTTTFATAQTLNLALPAGTWTVYALGGAMLQHSGGGSSNLQTVIDGNAGTARTLVMSSSAWTTTLDDHTRASVAGGRTITIEIQFKSSATGTTSSRNPFVIAIAQRTA